MKKPRLVVANFKMSLNTQFELSQWLANFSKAKKTFRPKKTELVLCPPLVHLDAFRKATKAKFVRLGAQNCFWECKGAFTGETSPSLLKSSKGEFVILGHSERRRFLGETEEMIEAKIFAASKAGIVPVVCVGENMAEKKRGMLKTVLTKQLSMLLRNIGPGRIENIVLCYEPVWAISANNPERPPSSNEIMEARLMVKKILFQKYGMQAAEKVRIIYGGSVDGRSASEVCVKSGMDGALVGNASLVPSELIKIAQVIDEE